MHIHIHVYVYIKLYIYLLKINWKKMIIPKKGHLLLSAGEVWVISNTPREVEIGTAFLES